MQDLNDFERAVLSKLLAGDHPVLAVLRTQAETTRVARREYTGAGFFLSFIVSHAAPQLDELDLHIGDVDAEVDGLHNGAGFVLFIRKGRLHMLEGYTYDEPWPTEIKDFKLSYQREPRDLHVLAKHQRN